MSWRDLLSATSQELLPWVGGRTIASQTRTWTIEGDLPLVQGWYAFETNGSRVTRLVSDTRMDPPDWKATLGYLVGGRFIPQDVNPATGFLRETQLLFCAPDGVNDIERVAVGRNLLKQPVFLRTEWPEGPEQEVMDRISLGESLDGLKDVRPALHFAYDWLVQQRVIEAERVRRREEAARQREARAQALAAALRRQEEATRLLEEARARGGTGASRRALAQEDFAAAATAALRVSGCTLLSVRQVYSGSWAVRYVVDGRRLECVVDDGLHVTDAGVCLDGHDDLFTLESLPGVIRQAVREGVLVVWRHG